MPAFSLILVAGVILAGIIDCVMADGDDFATSKIKELNQAVRGHKLNKVKTLVQSNGMDVVNGVDRDGKTPLQNALEVWNVCQTSVTRSIVRALINAGAGVGAEGRTPALYWAVDNDFRDMIDMLLHVRPGVDVNIGASTRSR